MLEVCRHGRGVWLCVWVSVSCFLIVVLTPHWTPRTLVLSNPLPALIVPHYKLPWWDGGSGCECQERGCNVTDEATAPLGDAEPSAGGTCGWRAWMAGSGQRVVSLSIYGNDPDYWNGLGEIIRRVSELYPGWVVRVYTDPRGQAAFLCPLLTRVPKMLYICDVTHLPPPLSSSLTHIHPMMWRVAPLGDPQVAAIMVRDSDSPMGEREAAAVREWLASDLSFHVMRDNPQHTVPVLGGMWGARWDQDPTRIAQKAQELTTYRDEMLKKATGKDKKGQDQQILGEVLWPVMKKGRVLGHDSYNCQIFPHSSPWPTQRTNGFFVGSPGYRAQHRNSSINKPCPPSCRPKNHQDWTYC